MADLAREMLAPKRLKAGPDAQRPAQGSERLRHALMRFAGVDGVTALTRRALALASAEFPALRGARLGMQGRVEGLEQIFPEDEIAKEEAVLAITIHLLELLATFIGEPLTRRFVDEACSGFPPQEKR